MLSRDRSGTRGARVRQEYVGGLDDYESRKAERVDAAPGARKDDGNTHVENAVHVDSNTSPPIGMICGPRWRGRFRGRFRRGLSAASRALHHSAQVVTYDVSTASLRCDGSWQASECGECGCGAHTSE